MSDILVQAREQVLERGEGLDQDQTLRVLQLDPVEYFAKAYLRPLACAVPLIAVGYAFSQVHAASWLLFVLEAGVMCAIFWIGKKLLGGGKRSRQRRAPAA